MNISDKIPTNAQSKNLKETPIENLRKKVSLLLFFYAVMALFMRISVFSFGFFVQGKLRSIELGLLLYYSLPFLVWLYSVKVAEPEYFLRKYTLIEGLNILLGLISKVPQGFFCLAFGMPAYSLFLVLGLAILRGVFFSVLFFVSKKVSEIQRLQIALSEGNQENPKEGRKKKYTGIATGVMVFCYLAPILGLNLNWVTLLGKSTIDQYELEAQIQHITGSSDGKLLAFATKKGVSVWDTDLRKCVWSDDAMPAQRVRFSPSGHYLAAVGRNPDRAQSDIAVFDVENFKRLPGFDLIQEDLSMDKTFHDVSFLDEGKKLSILWHEDWDWEQLDSEREFDIKKKEDAEEDGARKRELFCSTYSLSGDKLGSKEIGSLRPGYELAKDNVSFLPNGWQVLYARENYKFQSRIENRFTLVDPAVGTYRELNLPLEYRFHRMMGRTADGRNKVWISDNAGKYAYFSAIEQPIFYNPNAKHRFFLNEIDLKSGTVTELYHVSKENMTWSDVAISPDNKKVVLASSGRFLMLYFIDLKDSKEKSSVTIIERVIQGRDKFVEDILWLAPNRLVVSFGGTFSWVDLKESEVNGIQ